MDSFKQVTAFSFKCFISDSYSQINMIISGCSFNTAEKIKLYYAFDIALVPPFT